MRARSNTASRESEVNNHMPLFSVPAWQGHIRPGRSVFAYSALIIEFKWVLVKLKNVPHTISEEILIFMIFLGVSQLIKL